MFLKFSNWTLDDTAAFNYFLSAACWLGHFLHYGGFYMFEISFRRNWFACNLYLSACVGLQFLHGYGYNNTREGRRNESCEGFIRLLLSMLEKLICLMDPHCTMKCLLCSFM